MYFKCGKLISVIECLVTTLQTNKQTTKAGKLSGRLLGKKTVYMNLPPAWFHLKMPVGDTDE